MAFRNYGDEYDEYGSAESADGAEGVDLAIDAIIERETSIVFQMRSIDDEGASAIAEILAEAEDAVVQELDLSCNEIGDDGVAALTEALSAHPLRTLNLFRNHLRTAAPLVQVCLECTGLTTIRLHGNGLGNGGATAFADALRRNPALTDLGLASNGVADAGTTALADALSVNTRLQFLDIGGLSHELNTPTNVGATALATALRRNGALECLWLEGTRIGEEGVARLCDALRINCALRSCSVLPDKVAQDNAMSGDADEHEGAVYLQRRVDACLRLHARYCNGHVRWVLRTRVMCYAGRARALGQRSRAATTASSSLASWLCSAAPMWVVVRVCELLRPPLGDDRAWYEVEEDSEDSEGSGGGDDDDEGDEEEDNESDV
jgi:Ran GTPase-activating protein (RanGAP) involved in mRNA processing and transport